MHPAEEARRDILTFLDVAVSKELLALPPNYPVRREIGGSHLVSWPSAPADGLRGKYGQFSTPREYRSLVEHRQYVAVMKDGGLLQLYYWFADDGELVSHNLCYYPCPLAIDPTLDTDDEAEPFVDIFDSILEMELRCSFLEGDIYNDTCDSRMIMRAPIRFDYAPEHTRDDHAACHAHIAHPECRVPVFGPLSVGHFLRFVFANYYRPSLDLCDGFGGIPDRKYARNLRDTHRGTLHLEWLDPEEIRRESIGLPPR